MTAPQLPGGGEPYNAGADNNNVEMILLHTLLPARLA